MSIIAEALKKAEKKSQETHLFSRPKKSRSRVFLVISIILFSGAAIFYIMNINNSENNYSPIQYNVPVAVDTLTAPEITKVKPVEEIKETAEETKPMETIKKYLFNRTDLSLGGIMYSKDEPLAIINDSMMKEGEELNNIKVIKIRNDSVDIETRGKLITLRLRS